MLFCVPKNRFLRLNPSFFTDFYPLKSSDNDHELFTIELKDVAVEAFESLLLVMYPLHVFRPFPRFFGAETCLSLVIAQQRPMMNG